MDNWTKKKETKKKTRIQLKIEELHDSKYKRYIQSEEWKLYCQQKFREDGYRCRLCNGTIGGLQTHHRSYRHLSRERQGDTITLCARCHRHFHDNFNLIREVRTSEVNSCYG